MSLTKTFDLDYFPGGLCVESFMSLFPSPAGSLKRSWNSVKFSYCLIGGSLSCSSCHEPLGSSATEQKASADGDSLRAAFGGPQAGACWILTYGSRTFICFLLHL